MEIETAATLAVTILVASVGYLAKYLNDLRLSERQDQLSRVEHQLRELYGPLFSLVRASTITWQAFVDDYPFESLNSSGGMRPSSVEERKIWRHWIANVFMPLNEQMSQLVTEHADLLEEDEMPECLLQLSAHVYGYKGVIASWTEHDDSRDMSLIPFPSSDLLQYSERMYKTLKAQQSRLLGNAKRGPIQ